MLLQKHLRELTTLTILAVSLAACNGHLGSMSETGEAVMDKASLDQTFPDLDGPVVTNGFTTEGLAALENRVRSFVADGDASGISTLLVKDGHIVQSVQAGFQNVDGEVPMQEDTIFRIYSMTKPVIGVAMMMLYEDGLFELGDPVTTIIPEFADLKVFTEPDENGNRELVEMEREPTIADLMSHMAGFSYGFLDTDPLAPLYRDKQILASPDLETFIDRLADTALLHQPGDRWNYSVATDIQGAIIERLTGMTLGAFLEARIFEPLGMVDTGFRVPAEDLGRMADGFFVDPQSGELVQMTQEQIDMMGVVYLEGTELMESGGYGLASTLPDYARFCQMLLNEGAFNGVQLLQPETIKIMRQNRMAEGDYLDTPGLLSDNKKPGTGFGLNFGVVYDADASSTPYGQGSYFWGGLASTWFWIDPENDLYHIGMVQVYPIAAQVADFRRASADEIYAALQP